MVCKVCSFVGQEEKGRRVEVELGRMGSKKAWLGPAFPKEKDAEKVVPN